MKRTILILFGLILLSCKTDNAPVKPKNLISEDKMVEVLIDLSLLSSAKGLNKKILENNGITPDEYVYKKHKIDSLQFAESNLYYSYFIDDYDKIYLKVKDSLESLKIKFNRIEQTESEKKKAARNAKKNWLSKADSIKALKKDSLLSPPSFNDN